VFVSDEAAILHADLDSFYASVEQRDDPSLRGRPVVVGAGVVLAASYEAKAYGIRTAIGVAKARLLCPRAVVVPPRISAYSGASSDVFAIFERTAPSVEALSIDEAFLDVSGLDRIAGSPADVAERLRREVRERVGLPITVGIASTKFLAKVASAVAKPDGLLAVPAGEELEFLHPLAIERLWGVGRVTARKLHERGLVTVGQVARLPESSLVSMLGSAAGRHLHALAHNRDPRRVRRRRRRRSMGAQRALGRSPRSREDLDTVLVGLVERLARRLRSARRVCRTVTLRLRFADFSRATRSRSLRDATAHTPAILAVARKLLAASLPLIEARGITLLGVSLSNLGEGRTVQLALPLEHPSGQGLDWALDEIRDRFGAAAVTRAVLLGRDPGIAVPLLPD
jgi:DNA polymerase IV